MKPKEIKDIIKKEVEALAGARLKSLDEEIFFRSKFMDSMNLVNLIVFLEHKFGIRINAFFVDRRSVGTVNKLAGAIKRKLDKKTG